MLVSVPENDNFAKVLVDPVEDRKEHRAVLSHQVPKTPFVCQDFRKLCHKKLWKGVSLNRLQLTSISIRYHANISRITFP